MVHCRFTKYAAWSLVGTLLVFASQLPAVIADTEVLPVNTQGPEISADFARTLSTDFQLEPIQLVQDVQTAPGQTVAPPPGAAARSSRRGLRRSRVRLAGLPPMFGDSLAPILQLTTSGTFNNTSDIPLGGAARRAKVAENNKALPVDRMYFTYNHFHNALQADTDPFTPGFDRINSLERYTLGLEKTFCCQNWSVELRMPFNDKYRYQDQSGFNVEGGSIGNLAVILKRLVHLSEHSATAIGVGLDLPTGSDVDGTGFSKFTFHNEAVHFTPYIGTLWHPTDSFFINAFVQFDIAANGNQIRTEDAQIFLNEQNLFQIDASVGRWLYRCPCSSSLTGVAGILELHYTTTIQDADNRGSFSSEFDSVQQPGNRLDLLQLTTAIHVELGRSTSLRVGGVFPLRDDYDKLFDAELAVQLNRRF
jgi:hypothetical protein